MTELLILAAAAAVIVVIVLRAARRHDDRHRAAVADAAADELVQRLRKNLGRGDPLQVGDHVTITPPGIRLVEGETVLVMPADDTPVRREDVSPVGGSSDAGLDMDQAEADEWIRRCREAVAPHTVTVVDELHEWDDASLNRLLAAIHAETGIPGRDPSVHMWRFSTNPDVPPISPSTANPEGDTQHGQ